MSLRSRIETLRHRPEAGIALVEVVVSASVLLAATGATLGLIDGAQDTSVRSKARVVAADLAEQDQERLRATSALKLDAEFPKTRAETVAGVPYRVDSTATWLSDATGGDVTCTNGGGQADYLQITSTVAPATDVGNAPVRVVSLVAPKVGTFGGTGTLAVPVKDRSAGPMRSLPVTVSGPRAATRGTNGAGCAVFNYFPSGAYTVRLNTPGYVDKSGTQDVAVSGQITAGQVNSTADQFYDRAARVDASFETTTAAGATVSATAIELTVANSGIPNQTGSFVTRSALPAGDAAMADAGLFPFEDGYSVYAGGCAANDPAKYTAAGATANLVPVDPGAAATTKVLVPSASFTSRTSLSNVKHVLLTPTDPGCTTRQDHAVAKTSISKTVGTPAVAVPFGTYQACVDDGSNSRTGTLANTSPAFKTVSLDTVVSGRCT